MALMQAGRLFQNLLRERLHAQALHASACPCALRSGLQARTGNAAEWESTSNAAQGSPFPPSPPWQADWRRHYEDSSGEAISVPPSLNRRGKKLVRRREKEAETDEEVLADQEGLERVGLRGLQWMKALVDTPRRRQEGMLRDMYKDMQNPISQNYLLFKSAAEGDAEDQQSSGKEEKRMQEVDEDEDVERAFDMQIVDINRTNKATKGGRVMSITALVVVGNQDGVIGYGKGKAFEAEVAVDKAYHRAVKNLLFVPRYRGHTIYHPVEVKYGQTKVRMWPAEDGQNVRASKTLGGIADLAGIRNLKSKIIGSRHPHNVVKAVFKAFASIQTPRNIAQAFHRPVVEVRNMPFQ